MKLTNLEKDFIQKCAEAYEKSYSTTPLSSLSQAINDALAQMNLADKCPYTQTAKQDPDNYLVHIGEHCAFCSCGHINLKLSVHECVLLTYGDAIRKAIHNRIVAQEKHMKEEVKESE